MPVKTIKIEAIIFPKFPKSSSKRNFRLHFYIVYKDAAGATKTVIAVKPAEGQWQWKNPDKPFFFPEKIALDDSIELDTNVFETSENGFAANDALVAEIDGEIQTVAVQFIDVHDASLADFLRNKVLPKFVEALEKSGFNPIDLLPVPGIVTGVLKENVDVNQFLEKADDFIRKETKDKVLHRLSRQYDGENRFVLSGRKEWESNKTGTYAVTLRIE